MREWCISFACSANQISHDGRDPRFKLAFVTADIPRLALTKTPPLQRLKLSRAHTLHRLVGGWVLNLAKRLAPASEARFRAHYDAHFHALHRYVCRLSGNAPAPTTLRRKFLCGSGKK